MESNQSDAFVAYSFYQNEKKADVIHKLKIKSLTINGNII